MGIPASVANTIVDPVAYAANAPLDEAFSWLRAHAPFAKVEPDGFSPFWAVTKHADIQAVERQSDLFLAGVRPSAVCNRASEADMMARGLPIRPITQMDSPDHLAYRRLTQGWFMPRNLRKLEARIREIARELIDRMAAMGGECDFAKDVAFLFPLRVIMEILGVPREDEPRMLRLTQELFGTTDPELGREAGRTRDPRAASRNLETVLEFVEYFDAVTADRRAEPRDDLATAIAQGQVGGKPIGQLEAMGYYVIIAAAGHDTTSNATAGGLWALAEHQDQFARLKREPAAIRGFVDEAVRWVTPVKHFMRTAAQDTAFAGQKVAKGDWLMLCYQSGNRDEDVFADPFRFDIARAPNRHVAFGHGAHVCLGQHLGLMEMRIFWEELLPRLERVELAGEPQRTQATFVCGPKSVPIRFAMA